MDIYIIIVFMCLVLSLIMLFIPKYLEGKVLNIIFKAFVSVGIIKYISLFIFYNADSPKYLYDIKFLPMLSFVSIFILGYMIICSSKEQGFKIIDFGVIFGVLILGSYIVYTIPFGISNSDLGYILIKNKEWLYIESLYIITASVILIAIALKAFANTKVIKSKVTFIMLSISFVVVAFEEGLAIMNRELFHFNVVGDLASLAMFMSIIIISLLTKDKEQV